jgi:uncharacterized membrane-anchored protein
MAWLPPDHPERRALADEVHARPPEPLAAPARASYLALLVEPGEREAERRALESLFRSRGVEPPAAGLNQFSVRFGDMRFKWERHSEFSSYTVITEGAAHADFDDPAFARLPEGWLAALPGRTMLAAHALLLPARPGGAGPEPELLERLFGGNTVVGAEIGEGAAYAHTDFRTHGDGCSRFLIVDRSLTRGQAGRMLQRLFEIEAYRMLALLALPIARAQSQRLLAIEDALADLTDGIARGVGHDEDLLHELTRLAAEVESGRAASQFRFGATRAYAELVNTRIGELRERRIPGTQTIQEFMSRRFTPAVATCLNVSQRTRDLSGRVAQASGLLATRVGIAREQQNQRLLASMDRRAKLQLRLQQTVEGLSVAAITYYVAGLLGYVAKAGKAVGLPLNDSVVVGIAIPLVALGVMVAVRRARRHVSTAEQDTRID